MPVDLRLLGSKLERYRKQFDMSFDDVSVATGISVEALKSYEIGSLEPSGDEVLILADYYKCDYKFFISNEKLAPFEQTEELFRLHGDVILKEDRWSIQEFLFLCECEEFLVNELGGNEKKEFQFQKTGNHFKTHGENAAIELRTFLGYKHNEIGMNVYQDFRRLGFHVFRRHLQNSNISGIFIKHPTAGKCILVNYLEDPYRQRFTVCHEAAHAILDDEQDFVISFSKWEKGNLSEIRANTFASRYLMPTDFMKGLPAPGSWDGNKVIEWASKLKVSVEALTYALKEAQLITDEKVGELKGHKVSNKSKEDPELPNNLTEKSMNRREELLKRGLSAFYVSLCFDAYNKGIITAGRLGEMLLTGEKELLEISEIYRRKIQYGD